MSTPYKLRNTAARKAHKSSPARAKDQTRRKRVYLLKNELISLRKTPPQLIPVALSNSITSPLLRLPAEIRTKIWSHLLDGMTIHFLHPSYRPLTTSRAFDDFSFPLLRVCRHIYAETALLPCLLNKFAMNPDTFPRFLARSKLAHRQAIRKVWVGLLFFGDGCDKTVEYLFECLPNVEEIEIFGGMKRHWHEQRRTADMVARDMSEKTGRRITTIWHKF